MDIVSTCSSQACEVELLGKLCLTIRPTGRPTTDGRTDGLIGKFHFKLVPTKYIMYIPDEQLFASNHDYITLFPLSTTKVRVFFGSSCLCCKLRLMSIYISFYYYTLLKKGHGKVSCFVIIFG